MPYFSFSLKQNFIDKYGPISSFSKIQADTTFFSKNTSLWKNLNNKKNKKYINFIKFEKRTKIKLVKGKILFCLPPNIGLGDAIEYGIALNAICSEKYYTNSAIVFTGRYKSIFCKYFNFIKVYDDIISLTEMSKYDIIFHLSLEIKELKHQKYIRTDIESVILNYFKVNKKKICENIFKRKIKKINIFPVSQSPIRSMPPILIDKIIASFKKNFEINVVFDSSSLISNYIEQNIKSVNYKKLSPTSLNSLCNIIKNTEFGIFMDSGPLHVAKLFGIKGVLITTSVSGKVLLNQYNTIKEITNPFYSKYCKSPCGLTNLINFQNNIGCYESLEISNNNIFESKNQNALQRGILKNKYIDFMFNPVGCIKNINVDRIIQKIIEYIKN